MDVFLKKYFWVVNLLVIAICATFAGRAAAHLIEGSLLTGGDAAKAAPVMRRPAVAPPAKVHNKDADEIVKRNVFCSGCVPPTPAAGTPGGPEAPQSNEPQKTS